MSPNSGQQQRLEYTVPVSYSYGRWVRHQGVEQACNRIALWLVGGGTIWLGSAAKAGKTHFLQAIRQEHPFIGMIDADSPVQPSVRLVGQWLERLEPFAYWLVDMPAGACDRSRGLALYHLIERAREMNRPLLISWRCDEADLAPPELSSRLRMMERVTMSPPASDDDLLAVMNAVAEGMQWDVKPSLLKLMRSQLPRDLESQIVALTRLEAASLEERHRISQSWAREKLNLERNGD